MTPQAAVSRLAEIIAPQAEFTEDDVQAAMAEAGVPTAVAHRAYTFTQVAWGRALLQGLSIQFSPEYVCLNGAGDVIETGKFADEPYFLAAAACARSHFMSPGFKQLALMAAEVHGVNDLLNKGSKPENLVTAVHVLFLEKPTPVGMKRASEHLARSVGPRPKPWWRFW